MVYSGDLIIARLLFFLLYCFRSMMIRVIDNGHPKSGIQAPAFVYHLEANSNGLAARVKSKLRADTMAWK